MLIIASLDIQLLRHSLFKEHFEK